MGLCAVCHLQVTSKYHQRLTSETRELFEQLFAEILCLSSDNVSRILSRIDNPNFIVCKSCCGQSQTLTKHWNMFRQTLREAGVRLKATAHNEEEELDQDPGSPTKKKMTEKLRFCKEIEQAAANQNLDTIVDLICTNPLGQACLLQRVDQEAKNMTKADIFKTNDVDSIPKVPGWDKWFQVAKTTASFLTQLLVRACNGQEEDGKVLRISRRQNKTDITVAVITAIAVVIHARNDKCNTFQKVLTLTLRHNGVSKWVIKLFNTFHLGISYSSLLKVLKNTSLKNDVAVTDVLKVKAGGFCGDNLNIARIPEGAISKKVESMFTWFFYGYRTPLPPMTASDGVLNFISVDKFKLTDVQTAEINKYLLLRFTHLALNNCDLPALEPLKKFAEQIAPREIRHQYSDNMSQTSKIVVLNILNFDESTRTGMTSILDTMSDFYYICLQNAGIDSQVYNSLPLMFAGDVGTEEKAHNNRILRLDGTTPIERMQYLVTWAADWHLRVNYATYLNKRFRKLGSATQAARDHVELETGVTLLHRELKMEAKKCADATFLFHRQYLLASIESFLTAQLQGNAVPTNINTSQDAEVYMTQVLGGLMDSFGLNIKDATTGNQAVNDEVLEYNLQLLHLLLIADIIHDLTRHGNGLIVDLFKYLIPLFRSNDQVHYAGSLARAVLISEGILGPRAAHIIRNERTVKPDRPDQVSNSGGNVAADHHNEHINRQVKPVVKSLGSNFSQAALDIASGTLNQLSFLRREVENNQSIKRDSGYHTLPKYKPDIATLVERFGETNSFSVVHGRRTSGTKVGSLISVNADEHRFWSEQRKLELELAVADSVEDLRQRHPDYANHTLAEICIKLYGKHTKRIPT